MLKNGGTNVKPPKPSNSTAYKAGDKLVCIKSHSPAYTEGRSYTVYQNDEGWRCLMGDDGLEDIISMLVSSFKKTD